MAMLARSESRGGYAVRVLAVHTTEGSGTAESLRDATWWTGSSHALADESGKLLTPADGCVPYNLAAWTLRSGNRWSENIELVGFAKWKRADWLARPLLLDACARWLAERSKARGIPLVKLSPKEYAAGRSGVIGHVDHTVGYSDGTHWDPGPDFPYDVVLPKAAAYALGTTTPPPIPLGDTDMWLAATPDKTVWKITDYDVTPESGIYRMGALAKARGIKDIVQITVEELRDNQADAAARRGALLTDIAKAAGGDIDEAAIIAGLAPKVSEALSAVLAGASRPDGSLTRDDVLSAVREVFGSAAKP